VLTRRAVLVTIALKGHKGNRCQTEYGDATWRTTWPWRRCVGSDCYLVYSVNSSDSETTTFVLHKATKIKCCLFLQETPAVARKDALQPI